MSAEVLRPSRFSPRWRYRVILGSICRYWSAHDRPPQVWREGSWQDLEARPVIAHPQHQTRQ